MKVVAATFVLLAAVAVAGAPAPASAASAPSLGGTFGPLTLVVEREQQVRLTNRSTIPVRATLEVKGQGWTLAKDQLELEVGEAAEVRVQTAGPQNATFRAVLTPRDPIPGFDTTSLVLETKARHLAPFEEIPVTLLLIIGLAGLLVGFALIRRRLTRDRRIAQARLTRYVAR